MYTYLVFLGLVINNGLIIQFGSMRESANINDYVTLPITFPNKFIAFCSQLNDINYLGYAGSGIDWGCPVSLSQVLKGVGNDISAADAIDKSGFIAIGY